MTTAPERRLRLALVDVALADCDRLDRVAGGRCEVALVVVGDTAGAVAGWAELGGYPCTTDLRRLSAVVADAIAVGGDSARRDEVLALASLTGVRAAVLPRAWAVADPAAPAGEVAGAGATSGRRTPDLDAAFDALFGAAGSERA